MLFGNTMGDIIKTNDRHLIPLRGAVSNAISTLYTFQDEYSRSSTDDSRERLNLAINQIGQALALLDTAPKRTIPVRKKSNKKL
jgi:hypothetical protein